MKKRIIEWAEELNFSGTVRIEQKGKAILSYSRGWRQIPEKLPVNDQTAFGLASSTKTFTAAAVGVLIDRGEVRFETKLGSLLGTDITYVDPEATVEQLLTHKSGVFDYYDEELVEDFDNYRVSIPWCYLETPSDYLPLFDGKPAKFSPGERMSYSNGGYVLLGVIIEKLTSMPYRQAMDKLVLKPAGMMGSGFFSFDDLPANTALGYKEHQGKLISNIYGLPIRGGGDGGMYATAEDLSLFWHAYLEGNIVSLGTGKKLLTPAGEIWEAMNYGCGIYLPEEDCYMMQGCDVGVGSISYFRKKDGTVLTVLSNLTEGDQALFHRIKDEISLFH